MSGSETKWTDAQRSAIDVRGKTVLVSAAAGSGKTATLTERIIRRLTDEENPADISRFLVVTFTKASAADLKKKISKALGKALAENPSNRHLAEQMVRLGSASISTIDSFYYGAVKQNFDVLGLPPSLRVLDDTLLVPMREKTMESVIEDFYEKYRGGENENENENENDNENGGGSFREFMDIFLDSRGESYAAAELLSLYDRLSGYADFTEFLAKNAKNMRADAEKPFLCGVAGGELKKITVPFVEHFASVFGDALGIIETLGDKEQKKYKNTYAYLYKHFTDVKKAIAADDMNEAVRLFSNFSVPPVGRERVKSELLEYHEGERNKLKDEYGKFRDGYFRAREDGMRAALLENARNVEWAYKVLSEFRERFSAAKLAVMGCDFSDCKHFALILFVDGDGFPTPLAREYANRFDEIYIDEYQDTDAVQDLIFASIARAGGRFMVGDIKQSIYRFRGANPSTFAGYKNTFPPLDKAGKSYDASIYMSHNFRCDKPIIDFTNRVCGALFRGGRNSVGYTAEDDLRFGKRTVKKDGEFTKVKLGALVKCAAPRNGTEEDKARAKKINENLEERYIASEIIRLLSDGRELCEDGGVMRRIEPRDIAVLTGTNKKADVFAKFLRDAGIPTVSRTSVRYFENAEVLLALSLLKVIDNPRKDVYLAGVLRSPLYGFDIDDLARLRKANSGISLYDDLLATAAATALEAEETETVPEALRSKIGYFTEKLALYRREARRLGTDRLLHFIYSDTRMMSFAGGDEESAPNAASRRANLLMLYDYACTYEKTGAGGLYGFINYIDGIIESDGKVEPPATESAENAVDVMTIHASKGLEFPICFIASAESDFFPKCASGLVSFDREIGVGTTFGEETGFVKRVNPIKNIIDGKNRDSEVEERMRVLYVALTRARERLYISAGVSANTVESIVKGAEKSDIYTFMSCRSFLKFILTALGDRYDRPSDCFEFFSAEAGDIPKEVKYDGKKAAGKTNAASAEREAAIAAELEKRFDFEYPYSYLSELPAKMSVSKLYPGVLDDEADGVPTEKEKVTLRTLPAFLVPTEERAGGAERGTATHTFMQFCDFENAKKYGVRAEKERLCALGFLSPEIAELIDEEQLSRFFISDFFAELSASREIYREQRFNLRLAASLFTEDVSREKLLGGETVVVQGVIDLVFRRADGTLVLCDYKTDYLTEAEKRNVRLAKKKLTERHAAQLSYYRLAVREIFGAEPSRVCIYSLPLGDAVDIETDIKSV